MIELLLNEWADKILVNKQYVIRSIQYDDKTTIVMDVVHGLFYKATYNKETNRMELREVKNNETT